MAASSVSKPSTLSSLRFRDRDANGDQKKMNKRILRAFVATGALATACASWGCVADRPARNGVYNENQYIRKDFLIRSGATTADPDPGWFLKATIIDESIPNPLAAFDITDGS